MAAAPPGCPRTGFDLDEREGCGKGGAVCTCKVCKIRKRANKRIDWRRKDIHRERRRGIHGS